MADAYTIDWNPNPLLTSVTLTNRARTMLRNGIANDLEDENEVKHFLPIAIKVLETGEEHCGDCTCVPMSCMKCLAEYWLGIDTIKGVGKHGLYKIAAAFKGNPSDISAAIRNLENYEPKAEWEGWEAHAPRWRKEAEGALVWLRAYRDAHFPAQGMEAPQGVETTGSTEGGSPVAESDAP